MVLWAESSVFGFYIAEGGVMLRDVIPCSRDAVIHAASPCVVSIGKCRSLLQAGRVVKIVQIRNLQGILVRNGCWGPVPVAARSKA